ncbi:MAG: TonB-dependent receptor, partial [Robiginitomaculum sp.]|nr:TonB-dependent receptor [Robiginitomaculum sp.]
MKKSFLEKLLQSTIIAGFALTGPTFIANAQVVEQVPAADVADEDERDDLIVVTGSRIRRPDLETVFPTTIVGAEELDKSAFTNIADALTEIPSFGGGIDPTGGQGANIGSNFVDFLDLGVQRTLTVVNGRRFVGSDLRGLGLSVDFNVIPIALVERIDTIGIGGAPIYGSDAIAGTINVILKDDFEGLEATALYGQTERGDADRRQIQFVVGSNSADGRGNVTFSAEYFKQEGLRQLARPEIFTDDPFLSEVQPGTPGFNDIVVNGAPGGVFRQFNPIGGQGQGSNVQLFTNGGVISPTQFFVPSCVTPLAQALNGTCNFFGNNGLSGDFGGDFYQFAENGDLVDYANGEFIPGTSIFFAQGGNAYDFFDQVGQIQSPLERINFGSTVKYDINDSIVFKADMQVANTKSDELVNQGGFQTFAFGGLSGALQMSASNPFLTAQASDTLINTLGFAPTDTFFLSRFNNDLIDGGKRQAESHLWRLAAGFEGEFEFAGRQMYWDFHGVAGQSSSETTQPLLNDVRFLNAIDAHRLTAADINGIAAVGNDPIGANGDIVCQVQLDLALIDVDDRDATNAAFTGIRGVVGGSGIADDTPEDVTACQPLNIFGENNGSPEALDYVIQRGLSLADFEQRIWSANISGELFQVPAGWMRFSAGYETRHETGSFQSGGATEVGLGRASAVPDTGGGFATDEFSGELQMPLISPDMDIPFIYNAEIEGAIRQINSTIGGDATVYTVGGSFSPIQMLSIRGNKTRSTRTPSLTELFQPIVSTFDFADDPCDTRFIGDDPSRAANCAAVGITQPFTSNVVNATAQGRTGGNPNLRVEVADAFTVGAVFQPEWIPGLTLTADYFNIVIEDRIGARSLEQNLQTCFDAVVFDPNSAACTSFTRNGANQVVDFLSGQLNADSQESQFLNLKGDYRFDVADAFGLLGTDMGSDLGSMGLRVNAFRTIERTLIVDGAPDDNAIGGFGQPRWKGTVDFTYNRDALRVFWRVLWQDRNLFSPSGNNFFADANDNLIESVGGRVMNNASISYDVSTLTDNYDKPIVIQLNVDNVFNRTPGRGLRESFGNF